MSKPWGDPVFTVRMPKSMITGLKMLAKDEQCTTSDIIRDLVLAELKSKGYLRGETQLKGQQSFA